MVNIQGHLAALVHAIETNTNLFVLDFFYVYPCPFTFDHDTHIVYRKFNFLYYILNIIFDTT